ncbi:helix-turn-helix transcriptional regulator [Mycobacterium sp. KBS0706]|uniref:helix-turn-helix transcriptional regulator n=1 Tax=Mycobacterium sp. KBS0706 TaxID=2578109 RepID=UPI00110F74BE|nr:helix-turn-helix transcriptional regulator [Mycobacterium sp. KBS0706]TSD83052.1 helix-turn-helix transcriptional regulator [Mycobacterium sp. KBS0706]
MSAPDPNAKATPGVEPTGEGLPETGAPDTAAQRTEEDPIAGTESTQQGGVGVSVADGDGKEDSAQASPPARESPDPGSAENVRNFDPGHSDGGAVDGSKGMSGGGSRSPPSKLPRHLATGRDSGKARLGVVALLLSCAASFMLVIATGLLISFMQFQSRILKSEEGFTTGQLIDNVLAENEIGALTQKLTDLSEKISSSYEDFAAVHTEVQFRTDRICAIFQNAKNAKDAITRCKSFVQRIPSAETSARITEGAPPTSGRSDPQSSPSINERGLEVTSINTAAPLVRNIQKNFVEYMASVDIGSGDLATTIADYSGDFTRIAELNEKFWVKIEPQYQHLLLSYDTNCRVLHTMALRIQYRTAAFNLCSNTTSSELAELSAPNSQILQAAADRDTTASAAAGSRNRTPGNSRLGGINAARPPATDENDDLTTVDGNATEKIQPYSPALTEHKGGAIVEPPVVSQTRIDTEPRRQKDFELVVNYLFYNTISFGVLNTILISPTEFLAFLLVCLSGVLGSLLRIVLQSYRSASNPTLRSLLVGPLLGLICALVVYALFRSGFLMLTEKSLSEQSSSISPFVISLLSISAGLLSERAVENFEKQVDRWFGASEEEPERWGVNLKRAMTEASIGIDQLSERLQVDRDRVESWVGETDSVPSDRQRDISLILGVPARDIFTDQNPTTAGN